jgi:hypothetical protein
MAQPDAAASPTFFAGLTDCRTALAAIRMSAHSASPKPIADTLYSRRARTSRGTTVMIAPHCWHW